MEVKLGGEHKMLRGWIVVAGTDGDFVYVQVNRISHVQNAGDAAKIYFGNEHGLVTNETMEEVVRKIGQESGWN
jgi:hypothetical protein